MPTDKTQQAVAIFDKNAQRYQDRFMDTSRYHETFDVFCNAIAVNNAHVLELACGPGNITRYLLQQRPGFHILGTDLSPAMITLARINNPHAQFQLLDSRAISTLTHKYDAIMCGFCLPYLSKKEATQLIADAAAILQPGGVLYLSAMEDDYTRSGIQTSGTGDELFVYYHQSDYLLHALNENKFEVIELRHQQYADGNELEGIDLIVVAKLEKLLHEC